MKKQEFSKHRMFQNSTSHIFREKRKKILSFKKIHQGMVHTSVIPALGRLRQEDLEFKTGLGYIIRTYLKINQPINPGTGGVAQW
jgi:hypothetical protein